MKIITAEEVLDKYCPFIVLTENGIENQESVLEAMQEYLTNHLEALRSELKESFYCQICGGQGYTIEIEAECCGNGQNECCGVPNPIQVQKQCICWQGTNKITPETIDQVINNRLNELK